MGIGNAASFRASRRNATAPLTHLARLLLYRTAWLGMRACSLRLFAARPGCLNIFTGAHMAYPRAVLGETERRLPASAIAV